MELGCSADVKSVHVGFDSRYCRKRANIMTVSVGGGMRRYGKDLERSAGPTEKTPGCANGMAGSLLRPS